jgi:PucR C-terminal helix-turn-helix domain/GGDEF-like domain
MKPRSRQRPAGGAAGARAEIVAALRARRGEVEEAILTRTLAVARPTGTESPEYMLGLPGAIAAAIDFGLEAIAHGAERAGSIPAATLAQARSAAANRIGLSVVLRRYATGYSVLGDFLRQEVDVVADAGPLFGELQRELTALFDRLIVAVSSEYEREAAEAPARSPMRRLGDRVRSLLDGNLINTAELAYDLGCWHLGACASGRGSGELLRQFAAERDHRLLLVEGDDLITWAWFGCAEEPVEDDLRAARVLARSEGVIVGIGEPGLGLPGWRRSHRQALRALGVGLQSGCPITRYGEVALLAAVLRDEDLEGFLLDTFLAPLSAGREDGVVLEDTLGAFLAAGGNVSAAAAALGLARQTVSSRLHSIEQRIGRPLVGCAAELAVSLRIRDLRRPQAGLPNGSARRPSGRS